MSWFSEQNAVQLLRRELGITQGRVAITGALFYDDSGRVQPQQVLVSEGSWYHLVPHIHKIYIRSYA